MKFIKMALKQIKCFAQTRNSVEILILLLQIFNSGVSATQLTEECRFVSDSTVTLLTTKPIPRGTNKTINAGLIANQYFRGSVRWKFQSARGNNMTVTFDYKHFDLQGGCDQSKDPVVQVIAYPNDENANRTICGCTGKKIPNVVSSNEIEIFYRHIIPGADFRFNVAAMLSGCIWASDIKEIRQVTRQKFPQSITLLRDNHYSHICIELKSIKLNRNKEDTKCKKSFLTVTDDRKTTNLSICNVNGNYMKTSIITTEASKVFLKFKRAGFKIIYHSLNSTILGRTADDPIPKTVLPFLSEPQSTATEENSAQVEDGPEMYKIIGIALAIFVIAILALFALITLCKRQSHNTTRESRKALDGGLSTSTKGTMSYAPPSEPQAINNIMYERIVRGTDMYVPSTMESEIFNNDTSMNVRTRADQQKPIDSAEIENKRKLRLSQLAENYIPVKFEENDDATPIFLNKMKSHPVPASHERHNPNAQNPRLQRIRPPFALPCSSNCNIIDENKYETIDSPLTEKDLISPAYAIVVNSDTEKEQRFTFPSSQPTIVPGTDTIEDFELEEEMETKTPLLVATYVSTEFTSDCASMRNFKKPSRKEDNALPEDNCHLMGQTGKLSLASSEKFQSSERKLKLRNVFGKEASDETCNQQCLDKTTSNANMVDINSSTPTKLPVNPDSSRMKSIPNKPTRQQIFKENAFQNDLGLTEEQSTKNLQKASRYKTPRPSVPDLFVQCAYASGQDVGQIQKRLEMIAQKAKMKNMSASSSPELSPTSNQAFLYDSPRPSLGGSRDIHTDAPSQSFYDTPRPSLPNIFPGDVQNFIHNASSSKL